MTQVFLEGRLGDLVGRTFTFKARNVREVLSAIEANTGKLRSYFLRNQKRYFAVFVGDKEVLSEASLLTSVKGKTVRILPILFGSVATISAAIAAKLVAGAVAKAVVGFIIGAVLSSILAFGISMLIAKIMKPDDPNTVSTSSFIFGQAENVANQGLPVPIGYGRFIIGSRVISVNTFSVDKAQFNNGYFSVFMSLGNINFGGASIEGAPSLKDPSHSSNEGGMQTAHRAFIPAP